MLPPFSNKDFDDYCEDCGAAPGQYCFAECPSGYTAEMYQQHAQRMREVNGD